MPPSEIPGPVFSDGPSLREALTHPVAGRGYDFERLEFLGDAVIGLVLAEALRVARPDAPEGELSACRAALASRASLAAVSRLLGLPGRVDAGDEPVSAARIRAMDSTAENVFEAMAGAIFSDAGYAAARTFVLAALGDSVATVRPVDSPKNRLQEILQAAGKGANAGTLVEYRTIATSGPEHARSFTVEVWFDGAVRGSGEGASLKSAGEAAARAALAALGERSV